MYCILFQNIKHSGVGFGSSSDDHQLLSRFFVCGKFNKRFVFYHRNVIDLWSICGNKRFLFMLRHTFCFIKPTLIYEQKYHHWKPEETRAIAVSDSYPHHCAL